MALIQRSQIDTTKKENLAPSLAIKSTWIECHRMVRQRVALGDITTEFQAIRPQRIPVEKSATTNGSSEDIRKAPERTARNSAKPRIPTPIPVCRRVVVGRAGKMNVATIFTSRCQGVPSEDIAHNRGATTVLDNTAGLNTAMLEEKSGVKNQESTSGQNEPSIACDNEATSEKILKSYSSARLEFPDPDKGWKEDPMMVAEYASDIFEYLKTLEEESPIHRDFLESQEITPTIRMILVDWLVSIHKSSGLLPETMYLCVSILDRYMQENKGITADYYQLVGITALLIASKFEEIDAPPLDEFVYISAGTFSKREILAMERDILKRLNFNLGRPLALHFLRRYNKLARIQSGHRALGNYMLELTLMEYELCHVSPSLLAAAVCCLSMGILNEVEELSTVWTPALTHHSGYKCSDLKEVVVVLADLLVKIESSRFQTITMKYSTMRNLAISTCPLLNGPLVKKLIENKSTTTKSDLNTAFIG